MDLRSSSDLRDLSGQSRPNIALVSKGVFNHTNIQHTGVYTQTMTEPVQAALEKHADFKVGGEQTTRQAAPALQLPAPPIVPEAMRSDSGLHEMDWPRWER